MNEKRGYNVSLPIIAVLVLLYIGYGLTHPARKKARSQRITAVNAAPRIVIAFTLSNTPEPTVEFPTQLKQ